MCPCKAHAFAPHFLNRGMKIPSSLRKGTSESKEEKAHCGMASCMKPILDALMKLLQGKTDKTQIPTKCLV